MNKWENNLISKSIFSSFEDILKAFKITKKNKTKAIRKPAN